MTQEVNPQDAYEHDEEIDLEHTYGIPLEGIESTHASRKAVQNRHRNEQDIERALELYGSASPLHEPSMANAPETRTPVKRASQLMSSMAWGRNNSDALVRQQQEGMYRLYLHLLNKRVNERIRERQSSISIAVMCTGGGVGKTAFSSNIAVNISYAAQVAALVVEINENDGNLHFKMGIDRDNFPLLPEAVRKPELAGDGARIASNFGKHEQTSTYAILSHPSTEESRSFSLEQLLAFANNADRHVGVVVYDTGNGLGRNEVAALKCDILYVAIYAGDTTKYSAAFSTLANLYDKGHVEKVTKYSRVVITGSKPGETLDDHRERILTAVIKARLSITGHRHKWSTNPMETLHRLGLAREVVDENGEPVFDGDGPLLELCDDKFNLVAYSDYVNTTEPASVLPDETGLETSVGYLKAAYDAVNMEFPSHELKKAEQERRIKETREENEKPSINATSTDAAKQDLSHMSLAELDNLARAATQLRVSLRSDQGDKSV